MTSLNTREDVENYLREHSNWGRWGTDDEKGAVNLITPEKVRQAAGLVRSGVTISMSRDYPAEPAPNNAQPADQRLTTKEVQPGYGAALDYLGLWYHGLTCTHIDALCHTWGDRGIFNGRDPEAVLDEHRASFGGVEHWADGLFTRGVLLDVPEH